MTVGEEKRARRPVSYDTEPCEGRQASPSNPSSAFHAEPYAERDGEKGGRRAALGAAVVFRCTQAEKATLLQRADYAGLSLSLLMREALGLVDARRRRPAPKADPILLRDIGRIGGELHQIARWLDTASAGADHCKDIDALVVAAKLVAIERALWSITLTSAAERPDQPPC